MKKDQHTIPRFYLNNFVGSNPNGHVWTYYKNKLEQTSAIPKEMAFEKHFYSVRLADGSIDTTVEDCLAEIEGKTAQIYKNLLMDELPKTDEEKADFSQFLALMKFRTTAARRIYGEGLSNAYQIMLHMTAKHPEAFDRAVRRQEQEEHITFTEAEKADLKEAMLEPANFRFDIPKEVTLKVLAAANLLWPMLFSMKWGVITTKVSYFVTCDNPLLHTVRPDTVSPIYGDGGFANQTSVVSFPLSPKKVLILAYLPEFLKQSETIPNYVEKINEALIYQAENCVYSHMQSEELIKLVEKHKSNKSNMQISGLRPKEFGTTKIVRNWNKD